MDVGTSNQATDVTLQYQILIMKGNIQSSIIWLIANSNCEIADIVNTFNEIQFPYLPKKSEYSL